MQQNTKSSPRVWLYARLPGDELGTLNQLNFLRLRANLQNCTIVGTSIDTHRGWLHRSGYREMMRHVKSGDVDQVHICRLGTISHSSFFLYRFFRSLSLHHVIACAAEVSLASCAGYYRFAHKAEQYALRNGLSLPW